MRGASISLENGSGMALTEKSPTNFMDFPPEIRTMIYEYVFCRKEMQSFEVIDDQQNDELQIQRIYPRLCWRFEGDITCDLLRTSRQIYHEALCVLHSQPLQVIYTTRCQCAEYVQCPCIVLGLRSQMAREPRTSRLGVVKYLHSHSIFGSLRHICIRFEDPLLRWFRRFCLDEGIREGHHQRVNNLVRSMIPLSPESVALRSLEVNLDLTNFSFDDFNVLFHILNGFFALVPITIEVRFRVSHRKKKPRKKNVRDFKRLEQRLAEMRALHVAHMNSQSSRTV